MIEDGDARALDRRVDALPRQKIFVGKSGELRRRDKFTRHAHPIAILERGGTRCTRYFSIIRQLWNPHHDAEAVYKVLVDALIQVLRGGGDRVGIFLSRECRGRAEGDCIEAACRR